MPMPSQYQPPCAQSEQQWCQGSRSDTTHLLPSMSPSPEERQLVVSTTHGAFVASVGFPYLFRRLASINHIPQLEHDII